MEHNYAKLIELARGARIKYPNLWLGSVDQVSCAHLLGEMADALTIVCRQNRNLRHDLAQVERDYEANLEELLRASTKIENLKAELEENRNRLREVYTSGRCKLGDLLRSPFGGRKKLLLDAPGMVLRVGADDTVHYLDFTDGLRLRFEDGVYTGWYLPGGEES